MQHQVVIDDRTMARAQVRQRKTVVIADDGTAASIIVLDESQPATPGTLIEHLGRSWVVRGSRPGSRVLVAEPLERVKQ